MPQDDTSEIKEARRQMREGRAPLIEKARATYQAYLIAMKGWQRKNSELRENVGLLNAEFTTKGKLLRESARNAQEGGVGTVEMYKELSQQAKAVSALIEKELPTLIKMYEPVGVLYNDYQVALNNYNAFMTTWKDKLPDSDLAGRALELALTSVDKSLR